MSNVYDMLGHKKVLFDEEIKEDKESKYFDKFLMTRDIDYAIEILEELLEEK